MLRTVAIVAATAAVSAGAAVPAITIARGADDPPPRPPAPAATPAAPSKQEVIASVGRGVVQITGKVGDGGATGTGIVLDAAEGLIATNAHVVAGMSSIEATLPDRSRVPARLVASSPCDDLAVLEITPSASLTALPFAPSSGVAAGDHALAFGFPTSFEAGEAQTVKVTEGMVSAVNVVSSPDATLPSYHSTIQHQAPISPGNSGGPLVDDEGRVIGINTLGNSGERGEVQGQYYAISSDEAQAVLADLREGRSRTDVGLDLRPLSAVPLEDWYENGAAVRADFEQAGLAEALYVMDVRTGSPADRAGLRAGDVITALEGSSTDEVADVCGTLKSRSAGDELRAEAVVLDSDTERYGERFGATITLAG